MQAAHWKCNFETALEPVRIGRESAALLVLRSENPDFRLALNVTSGLSVASPMFLRCLRISDAKECVLLCSNSDLICFPAGVC